MQAPEEARRAAGWWANRSVKTKGLVVVAVPFAILLAALATTAWLASVHSSSTYVLAIAVGSAVIALAYGIALSQFFTSGITTRLHRLERETGEIDEEDLRDDIPEDGDEISRLSARLKSSASHVRARAEERDRALVRLEDILTASPVVSLRYDMASRRFSYASPNVKRLFGISPEQAVADPTAIFDRFHLEDARRLRDMLVDARRRRGERVEMVLRFRRDPASDTWGEAEATFTIEYDLEGKLAGVVGYIVDASERHVAQRAADERRSMLESIFHASPDTIVVRDVAGQVILGNSTRAGLIGVDERREHRYAPTTEVAFAGIVTPTDRQLLESLTARCIAGEHAPDPVITSSLFPDGETRKFETRARPVLDHLGKVTGTVTVSRDITRRVELEQSLRRASAEARRASDAKNDFLSRMSHELRTPLNAILGFAQLLELDELAEDHQSSVDQIQRAGRHLLSLINEVLDVSRIESGRLSLSPEKVEVGELLDEVTTLLIPAAEAAEIQLTMGGGDERGTHVSADRQRLLQVLLNLGSNAIKYNERGGAVSFRTSSAEGGCVRFEVRDTGPGIPRAQQDQLFIPFSRLGAERTAVEGTGVGLALSKQLVELMGGSIGVESVPGRGSTFWVELLQAEASDEDGVASAPDQAEPTRSDRPALVRVPPNDSRVTAQTVDDMVGVAATATATDVADADGDPGAISSITTGEAEVLDGTSLSSPDSLGSIDRARSGHADELVGEVEHPLTVLHIEDNASNASLVEQVLSRRPAVRLVSTPEAGLGLELAREYRPDLILLDLHLPDFSGDELLYRLKAIPELARTKVVVVSADATPARIRRMLDLGVEGYLTKPVDVEALLRLVDLEIASSRGAPA